MTEDVGTVYVGTIHRPLDLVLTDASDNPLDLTQGGVPTSFTVKFYNRSTRTAYVGTGTFVPIDLKVGHVQYNWGPSDLANPGYVLGQVTVTWADGTQEVTPEFLLPIGLPI